MKTVSHRILPICCQKLKPIQVQVELSSNKLRHPEGISDMGEISVLPRPHCRLMLTGLLNTPLKSSEASGCGELGFHYNNALKDTGATGQSFIFTV